MARSLIGGKQAGRTLVEPRAGVATKEGCISLLRHLEDAGSDVSPLTIDSLTRNRMWTEAQSALDASTPTVSKLNGYPVVSHGVAATRDLVMSLNRPVHCRANSTDLRLVAEVAFAGGMSGFVSGPMYSTMEYSKNYPLAQSIRNWQYIYRLMGKYEELGLPLVNDAPGFAQSGSYSVPALMHVGVVIEALIMAAQGAKHIQAYQMDQCSLAQDVAAILALRELTEEYLARFGYHDVHVYVASNMWNGVFPEDKSRASGVIALNAAAARLGKANLIYVKSMEEGIGVPTAEGNAASIRLTKTVLDLLDYQMFGVASDEVDFERHLNLIEARAILDAVINLGEGDPVPGVIRAFEAGILDIPFSPHVAAKGAVLCAKDARGAVRFLDAGGLPIPEEARRMERDRLAEREAALGRPISYADIVADIDYISRSGMVQ
jgi:methylaspartate mutase epsilon subunit